MDSKKLAAKEAMLKKMSNDLKEDARKPFGEELKSKKMQKVEVIAPDKKGLEKGLSKAQEILKAKFGEKGLTDDEMEEMDEDEMAEEGSEECPVCGESTEDGHEHEDEESDY